MPENASGSTDIALAQRGLATPWVKTTPVAALVQLQSSIGNRQTSRLFLAVQRESPERQVIEALDKPDPIAGVGDFPAAFRILNGLAMSDMLSTLFRLRQAGRAEVLLAHIGEASGVNLLRLRAAFDAEADKAAGLPAAQFPARHPESWAALPPDQQADVGAFLDPAWRSRMPLEDIPLAPDEALGSEYALGLDGDPERLQAVENELDRRSDDLRGWGTAAPGQPPAVGVSGTTNITPDVAMQILENYGKGEPPFKPELHRLNS